MAEKMFEKHPVKKKRRENICKYWSVGTGKRRQETERTGSQGLRRPSPAWAVAPLDDED